MLLLRVSAGIMSSLAAYVVLCQPIIFEVVHRSKQRCEFANFPVSARLGLKLVTIFPRCSYVAQRRAICERCSENAKFAGHSDDWGSVADGG